MAGGIPSSFCDAASDTFKRYGSDTQKVRVIRQLNPLEERTDRIA